MGITISGIDHLSHLMGALPEFDIAAESACLARDATLTKPPGALGRLEEINRWLCGWQARHPARLDRVCCRIFAGNHGIAAQGVSAFPVDVTAQMVANYQAGGAAINQLCTVFGSELDSIALDLDRPTDDFTVADAMSETDFIAAFNAGMHSVPADADLLTVGEMGIGNTTAAAAVAAGLFGGDAKDWTGRGTGVDDRGLDRKTMVVQAGLDRHRGKSPLDILRCLGGRELVAMAGAILSARLQRVPVLLDGYVCTAAAAALHAAHPGALDHCLVAHQSAEPGHVRLLSQINKTALLSLGMRLGEGSGAALAVGLVRAALACHTGMSTFGEAGVSSGN